MLFRSMKVHFEVLQVIEGLGVSAGLESAMEKVIYLTIVCVS